MSNVVRDSNGHDYSNITGKYGTSQVLTDGSTSSQSVAFSTETTLIRIATSNLTGTDAHFHYATGANPTASGTTSPLLPCGLVEYVVVNPGDKIAVLRGGGTDISLSVTEITN